MRSFPQEKTKQVYHLQQPHDFHQRRMSAPAGLVGGPKVTLWDPVTNHLPNLVLSVVEQSSRSATPPWPGGKGIGGGSRQHQSSGHEDAEGHGGLNEASSTGRF